MRRPSTRMSSCAGSAFVPSSVTVAPFTDTRPSSINFSLARRDAMPACDSIFCSRSIAGSNPILLSCPSWIVRASVIRWRSKNPAALIDESPHYCNRRPVRSGQGHGRAHDPAHSGGPTVVAEVERSLTARDESERTRTASPLYAADDAVRVDTTGRSVDEVVAEVLSYVERAS